MSENQTFAKMGNTIMFCFIENCRRFLLYDYDNIFQEL